MLPISLLLAAEINLPVTISGDIDNDGGQETIQISSFGNSSNCALLNIFKKTKIVYSTECKNRVFLFTIENINNKINGIFLATFGANAEGGRFEVISWNGEGYDTVFDKPFWTCDFKDIRKTGKFQILLRERYCLPHIYEFDNDLNQFVMVDRIYPEVYEDIVNYDNNATKSALNKASSFSLSPDGSKLVFSKVLDGVINHKGVFNFRKSDLWLYDSFERKYRQLTTNECSYDPDFSKEGDKLTYIRKGSIYILMLQPNNEDKFKEAYLPENPKNEFDYLIYSKPIWSPNNSSIAALAENGGTSWVEVIEVNSKSRIFKSKPETYDFKWVNDKVLSILTAGNWQLIGIK